MKELAVFQQMFALKPEKILTWLDLIDQRLVWEPQLIEKVVVIRFLVDHTEEATALKIAKQLYRGRDCPVPVMSIVNQALVEFDGMYFRLADGAYLPEVNVEAVFTSFAVNVGQFASTAAALQQSSSAGRPECSASPAADEAAADCPTPSA